MPNREATFQLGHPESEISVEVQIKYNTIFSGWGTEADPQAIQ